MRIGILGWGLVLVGCTASTAPPTASATNPPAPPATSGCTDSSQCAAGALCCPSIHNTSAMGEGISPFGNIAGDLVCTSDPKRDCSGHEICGAEPCRSPWPPSRPPPIPARTYVSECRASQDCPKDATCALFYFQKANPSSLCVYNFTAGVHKTHTAPLCATDADCKSALALWKSDAAGASPSCVDLTNDIEHRRACAVPGNAPLP